MTKKIGLIAAAGLSSRINGIPKFLLPIKNNKNLITNSFVWLQNAGVEKFICATNKTFQPILSKLDGLDNFLRPDDIKIVNTKTMNETINNIIPANVNEQDIFITIMPDTYFDDFELGKKIIEKLDNNPELDAVLGLFKIRPEQLGKLGQCEINKDRILSVVDKDPNCKFDYSWGVITWRGRYSKFIDDKDPHFGYSINRAIEDGAIIDYVISDSEYYDCGTIDEYWEMVSTLI